MVPKSFQMKKLAKREEQIMQVIWERGPSFVKEVVSGLPEPKPHYNSVATMVKILETKGFLGHEAFGKTFRYFPVISKEAYQEKAIKDVVESYFNNSFTDMVAFFAKREKIDQEELKKILKMIKKK